MGKDPAMPFYVNDWLSSSRVARMTLEQQGAYMRLLCHCWASQDASLPADDDSLKALSGLGEGWLLNGSRLVRDCFEPHPTKTGYLTQQRVLELWQERQEWRDKSAEGGRKSGETRRLKQSKGGCSVVRTKREPKGNSSSSSSSSIKKETKAKKDRPTNDDVASLCAERGYHFDPESFVAHYEANGWVQNRGKPIVDWKAAAAYWERRWVQDHKKHSPRLPTDEEKANWSAT